MYKNPLYDTDIPRKTLICAKTNCNATSPSYVGTDQNIAEGIFFGHQRGLLKLLQGGGQQTYSRIWEGYGKKFFISRFICKIFKKPRKQLFFLNFALKFSEKSVFRPLGRGSSGIPLREGNCVLEGQPMGTFPPFSPSPRPPVFTIHISNLMFRTREL